MKQRILAVLLFGLLGITSALAQEREITGRVVDSEGSPMPGASVVVVETKTGNSTDTDGRYKVKASTGNKLQFSFAGYKTEDRILGAESNVDVVLTETTLTEVIVTGYGNVNAETFSGSASKVGSKSIEQIPIASFDQILQGRVPGLQGGTGSGQPGSSANILIRGAGSISGNTAPLYILDGIPIASGDFASMNGNDFESVTVLKDAASTSKYGSRGANGVIVIKSKSGKAGKTQLNYRFQQGVTTRTTSKFSNMNTAQRLDFERMLAQSDINNGTNLFIATRTVPSWRTWILAGSPQSGPAYNALQTQLAPLRAVDTDWRKEFFRTGRIQSHDLSATGGDEKTNFFVSTQYRREEGIINNSGLDRYTLRANVQHNANDKFRFGINTSVGYSRSNLIPSESGNSVANPVLGMYTALPYDTPDTDKSRFILQFNPSVVMNVVKRTNDNYKLIAGAFLEYDFTKELTLRTNWGGDMSMDIFKSVTRPTDNQNQIALNARGAQGNMGRRQDIDNSFVGTTTLTYNKTFGTKHSVLASANFEIIARAANGFSYTGFGINPKFANTPAGIVAGTAANGFIPVVGGYNTLNRLASTFADATYSYDGKYSISAGVRRDGSSRFGSNKRYGVFYSVSGAWNIDKEAFMENIANVVNEAKIRMSYGAQGNQTFGDAISDDFRYLATMTPGTGYAGGSGLFPNLPANPDVQWESQATTNIALDFGLFKNRIKGTVEVYNRKTTDLFVLAQVTRTTGFRAINRNIGEMRNRGIELNLTGDVLKLGDFTWTLNVIHTINRNKILSLGAEAEYVDGTSIVRVGIPLGSHYVVKWGGVNPGNGDPLYYDLDGNVTPTYNSANNQAFGTFIPPKFGSFTNTFSYKGLELAVFFVYESQKQLFNNQTFFNQNLTGIPVATTNKDSRMLNAWTTPGQVTDIPRLDAARQFSSRDLEDGSFLRLRNVTLAYTVPTAWAKNLKMRSLRAYVSGQNVLTFSKFTGFDPEDSNNIQLSQFPVPRVFTFGLDLGF